VGKVVQSVQRLATGWKVRGSNPGGDEIFRTCPYRPWGPASLLYNEYRAFPGGKERPERDADPSPLLVPWSRKGRAIPLLPLWAIWPVQSLSACTRVCFYHECIQRSSGTVQYILILGTRQRSGLLHSLVLSPGKESVVLHKILCAPQSPLDALEEKNLLHPAGN
jgi:hypothetical protein